jgi:hypothetical protein
MECLHDAAGKQQQDVPGSQFELIHVANLDGTADPALGTGGSAPSLARPTRAYDRVMGARFIGARALLVVLGAAAGVLVPAAALAAEPAPRWAAPEVVAYVPLGNAWFASEIAVADFNGDGHPDVLITRQSGDAHHTYPVTVLLGDGTGHFADGTNSVFEGHVPRVQAPRQIVIADFNGDHRPDAFIADQGDDHPPFPGYQDTLILSRPGGRLIDATGNLPQVYGFTHSAAAADVNGDGTVDLYVGNIGSETSVPPRILLNDGTGHFTVGQGLLPPSVTDVTQVYYTGSTFVDVNGDGKPDLVLSAGDSAPDSTVLLNDGTGHFRVLPNALPAKPFAPNAIGLGPISFDVNGDGRPDLLIGYTRDNPFYVGRWIQVLINNGGGTFSDETGSYLPQADNTDGWPMFFRPADLQRDGHLDFGLVSTGSNDTPHLYLRDQNGAFEPGPAIGTAFQSWAFIDATGDGSHDIIGVTPEGLVYLVPELRAGHLPPPRLSPPAVSQLRLSPKAFRAARSGASAPIGATVGYLLSEASTTTFTVDRVLPGVMRRGRCLRGRPQTGDRRPCTRYVPLPGSFSYMTTTPSSHFRFDGRIGGDALTAGMYRLDATPKNFAGTIGRTVHARFRVVKSNPA